MSSDFKFSAAMKLFVDILRLEFLKNASAAQMRNRVVGYISCVSKFTAENV